MDENNLVDIIKNEDKPFLSLARLAEKFENQPYGVKIAEVIVGGGLSLGTLVSCVSQQLTKVKWYVPVIYQETDIWCGAACGQSWYLSQGVSITQKELAEIMIKDDNLLDLSLLLIDARDSKGYDIGWNYYSSSEKLKNLLRQGIMPFYNSTATIMEEETYTKGEPLGHCRLIYGFKEEEGGNDKFFMMDPAPGRGYITIDLETAEKMNMAYHGKESFNLSWIYPKNKNEKKQKEAEIVKKNQKTAEAVVNEQINEILGPSL